MLSGGLMALRMMRMSVSGLQQHLWTFRKEISLKFPDFTIGLAMMETVIGSLEKGIVDRAEMVRLRDELKTYPAEWIIQDRDGKILMNSAYGGKTGFKFLKPSLNFLNTIITKSEVA